LNLPLTQQINSLTDTKNFAAKLADILKPRDIIVINGELGSGKTTLISHVCLSLKIDNVSSPSFSIVNEYYGALKVYHFDFYRIKKVEELYDLGFEDYVNDEEAIIFIEWGNLFPEIIPISHCELNIKILQAEAREFTLIRNQ
jgi:tRNA threonylcarbamoyladenosine biosynthesis protein TsaE